MSKHALYNSKKLFIVHSFILCMSVHMGKWAVFILSRFCPTMFLCIANYESSMKWFRREVSAIFCGLKLDYNPTQHLYTGAIQNRVLTLRCWKSSTDFEIFKSNWPRRQGRTRQVVFEWKTGTQSLPRLDSGTYGIGYGLTDSRRSTMSSPPYFLRDSSNLRPGSIFVSLCK